jgi:hypothetical protein
MAAGLASETEGRIASARRRGYHRKAGLRICEAEPNFATPFGLKLAFAPPHFAGVQSRNEKTAKLHTLIRLEL